jgi:hypothetical protein
LVIETMEARTMTDPIKGLKSFEEITDNEDAAAYYFGNRAGKPVDLNTTCQATIDRCKRALSGIATDISAKEIEALRVTAELEALKERRQAVELELSGARAALVAMNGGGG